ncbi:hypothetical protein [Flavobacterium sp.]|uniref:hypothetical protein n=1 Tax=Flavobacterium sp. TaxID=239 RepID=UPI0039E2FAB1
MNVIIVDGHPVARYGYPVLFVGTRFNVECVSNLEDIHDTLMQERRFSIVCIDATFCIQDCERLKYLEHLILDIRNTAGSRIVLLTGKVDAYSIHRFSRLIGQGSLIALHDVGSELLIAFEMVLDGGRYLSRTIEQKVKLVHGQFDLDEFNYKIIALLAEGVRTKNLPDHIPLSINSIDKRKAYIKMILNVEGGSDGDIIREARNLGII